MDKFWLESAKKYSKTGFEINTIGTHPAIIEAIKRYKPGNVVMDYGCGDGELLFKLGKAYQFSIFDISERMLNIAEKKLKGFDLNIYRSAKNIPDNKYDITILSMVLICIDKKEEIFFILNKLKKSKKKNGICIIAIPHPCFRNEPFSSYYTEFTVGKKFNYFKEGQPHKLFMRNTGISFVDYNWTLSFILNTLSNYEFQLVEIKELQDNKTNIYYNSLSPPSLILICK